MALGKRFMMPKKFTATREQRDASDPENSVWVTANAGSGKTHILVERVIRLLIEGAEPASILCITFTKAAASEMSARLFARLSGWIVLDDENLRTELGQLGVSNLDENKISMARRLFSRALETPGGLKIQTIHALCEKLLQQFPIEANITPGFKVMDERESALLKSDAIEDIIKGSKLNQDAEINLALVEVINRTGITGFKALIGQMLGETDGLRTVLESGVTPVTYELALKEILTLNQADTAVTALEDLLAIDRSEYLVHSKLLIDCKPYSNHNTPELLARCAAPQSTLEDFKKLFLTKSNTARDKLMTDANAAKYPSSFNFLDREKSRFHHLLVRYDLLQRLEATIHLYRIVRAVFENIETKKKYRGCFDFNDLISRTARLLSSKRATQWVLYKLDNAFNHILVDESQDTSLEQWKIISALSEEFFSGEGASQRTNRTLFVVGDRKQSIYSFQGADVHSLAQAQVILGSRIKASGKTFQKVDLVVSYRSTPEILSAVDKVFPATQPTLLGFDANDASENTHQSTRLTENGVFEIWPLVKADEEVSDFEPWTAPVNRQVASSPRRILARTIAEKIRMWLTQGRLLSALNRPVQAGDILILFQSRGPLFSMVLAELRKANIPVAGADRLNLHKSLAVQDLILLIQWVLLPNDDFALACVLKSPLVPEPLDEDSLIGLAVNRGTQTLWQKVVVSQSANAIYLQKLRGLAEHCGPYEFIAGILNTARRRVIERLGVEALDATDAFLDQALTYETQFGQSLTGFLHWFQGGETNIKRETEKSADEVRLMTVHGAKGLESNIVILADSSSIPSGGKSDPVLLSVPEGKTGAGLLLWSFPNLTSHPELEIWKDAEAKRAKAEHNRLLYVAMTRASDELYICGAESAKKIPEGSWYATVQNALGPTNNADEVLVHSTVPPEFKKSKAIFELPDWVTVPAAKEVELPIYRATSLAKDQHGNKSTPDSLQAEKGIFLHMVLQHIGEVQKDQRLKFAHASGKRFGLDLSMIENLVILINSDAYQEVWGNHTQTEVELSGMLKDGREISGRIDAISIDDHTISVLDYKSDRHVPDHLSSAHPYVSQMAIYVELLQMAYPNHVIRAALLWTQTAKLVWISEDFLTRSRELALPVSP
jgi:ATP-dependent helicase/nuclease subunit A